MMTTLSNSGSSSKHASPTKSRGLASPLLKHGGSSHKSRNHLNTSYVSPGEASPNTSFTMTMKPTDRRTLALNKSSSALNSSLNLGRSSTNQTLFTPVRSKMLTSKKGAGSAAKNRKTSAAANVETTASTTPGSESPVNESNMRKEIKREKL